MKFIHSLISNSFLMLVLFAMLFLPIGAMGLSTINQSGDNAVLSETSARDEATFEEVIQTTSSADLGQEVYYQQQEQTPQDYSEQ